MGGSTAAYCKNHSRKGFRMFRYPSDKEKDGRNGLLVAEELTGNLSSCSNVHSDLLSQRAEFARDWSDFLYEYLSLCCDDPYDEKKNPTGFINMGTAVNFLCSDLVFPKITCDSIWSCDTSLLDYNDCYGIMRLRKAIANLMTDLMETHEPVSPKNLFCLSGVTSCIDLLAHCLANPGDVFLVPTPVYGRIFTDLKQRALVDMYPIHIIDEDSGDDHPVLTMDKIIKAYENAIAEKFTVRGVFLINPNNPLGDLYNPELLMKIFKFCQKNSLHVIVDEVYAFSTFKGSKKFHSVLSFPTLPDPERTHTLYGLSKDFGLSGLRIGVIHTTCEPLQKCIIQLSNFQNIPYPVMDIAASYLEDLGWIKNFISENQKRLTDKYNFSLGFCHNIGLKVRPASAGFFLWVDFRHMCKSFEEEREFFEYLIEKAHLYIGPGKEFFCSQPGWFRIVFTKNENVLNAGFCRLEKAYKEYQQISK